MSCCRMEISVRFIIHQAKIVIYNKIFNNVSSIVIIFTSPKNVVPINLLKYRVQEVDLVMFGDVQLLRKTQGVYIQNTFLSW